MKDLKQIILCSQVADRSFIRNIRVTNEYALVTSVEKLPFRYHEFLLTRRKKKDREARINVPFKGEPASLRCAYCDNTIIFQCDKCGFQSCTTAGASEHYCPGCRKTYRPRTIDYCDASNSGFVGINLIPGFDSWDRAQLALRRLVDYRNRYF